MLAALKSSGAPMRPPHTHTFQWGGGEEELGSKNCLPRYSTRILATLFWKGTRRSIILKCICYNGKAYRLLEAHSKLQDRRKISGVATDFRVLGVGGWVGGTVTSKPTCISPIFCFSSVLGHLILLKPRLHNFWYIFENKNKNVTSLPAASPRFFEWGGRGHDLKTYLPTLNIL